MSARRDLRLLDLTLITAALAAAVYMGVQVYAGDTSQPVLVIESPEGQWIYQLNSTVEADIPGPLGLTHVVLENGTARITESPCPNRTCISAPHISRPGSWTACLPNHVLIRIEGKIPEDIDAVGY